jgi:hypothetical protein
LSLTRLNFPSACSEEPLFKIFTAHISLHRSSFLLLSNPVTLSTTIIIPNVLQKSSSPSLCNIVYFTMNSKSFSCPHTEITLNLLNPTGHVMHQQSHIQQFYVLPTHCIYVSCIYPRTNSNLCHLYHKLIGFL